jgi:phosphotransferase system HPr (HPr) family protein
MTEVKAVIKNHAGIHCRPTAVITQAAEEVSVPVTVRSPTGSCQIGSALELLMLGLDEGTEITIAVDGPDEKAVAAQFKELFETEFDFPNAGDGE